MAMERWLRQGIDDRFLAKLAALSPTFGAHPAHVLAVMCAESGIRADARNPSSRATGLIQFMPETAANLGTNVDELRAMTPFQQLDFVGRYYRSQARAFNGGRPLDSTSQLYAATFWPASLPLGDDVAFITRETHPKTYSLNTILDSDKDGRITKRDLAERIRRATDFADFRLLVARLAEVAPNLGPPSPARVATTAAGASGAVGLLAVAAFFLWGNHGKSA